ncbi:protein involved in carbohydrate transport [Arthrobacter sp. Hiyo8]|nr:protein involved in carbohydrate transport [Arthrobacter sp. Hiyo8]
MRREQCRRGSAAKAAYAAPAKDLSAELSYAIWDAAQKPAMQKIVTEFNKQYPNIKVTIDVTPSKARPTGRRSKPRQAATPFRTFSG